ncbi:MAG: helix-turn-helix domain-containing protein, partial [Chloroflexi bacterium]|nr:helix-turn-helix domain-containing protein [Chloroflexota bacterium]
MSETASTGPAESFRDLLLRYRGRSGLTQRQLAERVGVHRRSVQEWEAGFTYPSTDRLESLVRVLVEAHGLTPDQGLAEAEALWAAVQREAPHVHSRFDQAWFERLAARHPGPPELPPYALEAPAGPGGASRAGGGAPDRRQDWGEAPDTTEFVGRTEEFQRLRRWVRDERSRLVAVLGMGGIGKTSLVAKLAQDLAVSFERVYWRSMRDAPPIAEWLGGAIGFLSDQQLVASAGESERLTSLLQLLRQRRCLLVLDNSETLFEAAQLDRHDRVEKGPYGRLLQAVGEASHQSCLIVTSREWPVELSTLSGGAVQTLYLRGLSVDEAQALLATRQLEGTPEQWGELTARVSGNGLALKIVGETVRDLFAGEIGSFLQQPEAGNIGSIRRLLKEQIERCSAVELQRLRVLAIEREPLTLHDLSTATAFGISRGAVLEALETLRRRSLIERAETPGVAAFTLQSVVLEYVTDRLVEDVADEIENGQPVLLVEQPLIKARAKDYVRQAQERVIGGPILQRLKSNVGEEGTQQRLFAALDGWRDQSHPQQGFGPGNVVNLLRLLRSHLRGLDLSCLSLRQAYLATDAQGASLAGAHLADAVLAESFDFPGSLSLSGDGALLAAGTSTGQVCLWQVADRTLLWVASAHTGMAGGVALSFDGRLLASGGDDGSVRVWETSSGRPLVSLQAHQSMVGGVALSADGHLLASSSFDETAKLWDASTGQLLATLRGHTGAVYGVAVSVNGDLVATGGFDGTVRLWEGATGRLLETLHGHAGPVWSVALSADANLVASGGEDGTVRLWNARTAGPRATLRAASGRVYSVRFPADGRMLVISAAEGTVRVWMTGTAEPQATL